MDSKKISFILSCEITAFLNNKSSSRDKVILFSDSSEISEFIEHEKELINSRYSVIPTGKIIATYLKSTTRYISPKLLFSIRKSKPSWFTAKRIFASIICCSGLSGSDIEEIISWNKENSIPYTILIDSYLQPQRLEYMSEKKFHIFGIEKNEINFPNKTGSFVSLALKTHEVVKSLKTMNVNISGQIQYMFDNTRSILKQIADYTQSNESEKILYSLRVLLKKIESIPCKVNLGDRYFTEQVYDTSIETDFRNLERMIESYDGLGKSSMLHCISNIKQIIKEFSISNPPKFSEILKEVNTAIGKKESLLILFSSKAHINGFYSSFKQTKQFIDEHKLKDEKILFAQPYSVGQGTKCDRIVIVSDYPHSQIFKAFIGIDTKSAVLLHYPGENITLAMEQEGSYEFSKKYFNHNERKNVIERIENDLYPPKLSISKKRPIEEERVWSEGKAPLMPEIKVDYNSRNNIKAKIQSNQDSQKNDQSRIIKVTFSDGEEMYITEKSIVKVLLTNGSIETKRAVDLIAGDQVISFKNSIVTDIYSAIRDELKDWDPKTFMNFSLVEIWKSKLKQLMKDRDLTASQMVEMLSEHGSKVEEAETIKNWTLDLDLGGVIGPQDKINLERIVSLFPEYFNKIPIEELHEAISWVRGLPNRLMSLSQKVILAKEFGEQTETDADLLLYDIGKGLELKIVSLTEFSEK